MKNITVPVLADEVERLNEKLKKYEIIAAAAEKHDADEVKRLNKLLDEMWPIVNRQRGNLIDANIAGNLTEADEELLTRMQDLADRYLDYWQRKNNQTRNQPNVEIRTT